MLKRLFTTVSRTIIGITGLSLTLLLPMSAHAGNMQAGTVSVDINKTQVMQLSAPAGAVVVGNPAIADISVHSPTLLFVVGRGYGTTNVIILDEAGNVISNSNVQVGFSKSTSSKRVLMAGKGWQSYDCTPICQPAPVLGDSVQFIAEHGGKEKLIDNTSSPIKNTSFPGQAPSSVTRGISPPQSFAGMPGAGFTPPQLQQMPSPFANTRPSNGDY